eukprot:TRINITY_DN20898_c0_g1_i1.p2 TRINITY_DN20898_c0_g1~~TRINITY_DN20898_c0_g1_i1.p2  ORF type:complete len:131 (+),score=45.38 TRINITY_DN20898_c0_g1_i1:56-394(+)
MPSIELQLAAAGAGLLGIAALMRRDENKAKARRRQRESARQVGEPLTVGAAVELRTGGRWVGGAKILEERGDGTFDVSTSQGLLKRAVPADELRRPRPATAGSPHAPQHRRN